MVDLASLPGVPFTRSNPLTREAEPDDAAKLLMAVRRAREQLIIEQMMDALNTLSTKDFTKATAEQTTGAGPSPARVLLRKRW